MQKNQDVLELTQDFLRIRTLNPPGDTLECANLVASLCEVAGFTMALHEFAPGQVNLIATLPPHPSKPYLCFCGHLDTIPLGAAPWSVDPFAGEIVGDRLYGRGSSDMKGGLAAMLLAACKLARHGASGLMLVCTSAEETGCLGSIRLVESGTIPAPVGAMLIAEPTSNYPLVGHKGIMWIKAVSRGMTAHGSMPEKGENAIYKAAHAITTLETLALPGGSHPTLGHPTLNVGTISGGMSINVVPDEAVFEIDVRTTPEQNHAHVLQSLKQAVGDDVELTVFSEAASIWTDPGHPWVQCVFDIYTDVVGESPEPRAATYFTDASYLTPALDYPPTILLGPGEAAQAHQTDEYCSISRLRQAVDLYERIGQYWNS